MDWALLVAVLLAMGGLVSLIRPLSERETLILERMHEEASARDEARKQEHEELVRLREKQALWKGGRGYYPPLTRDEDVRLYRLSCNPPWWLSPVG